MGLFRRRKGADGRDVTSDTQDVTNAPPNEEITEQAQEVMKDNLELMKDVVTKIREDPEFASNIYTECPRLQHLLDQYPDLRPIFEDPKLVRLNFEQVYRDAGGVLPEDAKKKTSWLVWLVNSPIFKILRLLLFVKKLVTCIAGGGFAFLSGCVMGCCFEDALEHADAYPNDADMDFDIDSVQEALHKAADHMEDPQVQEQMQSLLNDPDNLQEAIQNDDQLRALRDSNPFCEHLMSDPDTMRVLTDPDNLRALGEAPNLIQADFVDPSGFMPSDIDTGGMDGLGDTGYDVYDGGNGMDYGGVDADYDIDADVGADDGFDANMDATGGADYYGDANMDPSSGMDANGGVDYYGDANMDASSGMGATGGADYYGDANMDPSSGMDANGGADYYGDANVDADGDMDGDAGADGDGQDYGQQDPTQQDPTQQQQQQQNWWDNIQQQNGGNGGGGGGGGGAPRKPARRAQAGGDGQDNGRFGGIMASVGAAATDFIATQMVGQVSNIVSGMAGLGGGGGGGGGGALGGLSGLASGGGAGGGVGNNISNFVNKASNVLNNNKIVQVAQDTLEQVDGKAEADKGVEGATTEVEVDDDGKKAAVAGGAAVAAIRLKGQGDEEEGGEEAFQDEGGVEPEKVGRFAFIGDFKNTIITQAKQNIASAFLGQDWGQEFVERMDEGKGEDPEKGKKGEVDGEQEQKRGFFGRGKNKAE